MTHDPGISIYTYEVPMTGFSAGDTLYFAAHGEVEKWIEGDLVTSRGFEIGPQILYLNQNGTKLGISM